MSTGPGWLKQWKPPTDQLRGVPDLSFANVLSAHGEQVIGEAREHYRPVIERMSAWSTR